MNLTPTEERIFAVLSDGRRHHNIALKKCIDEDYELVDAATLRVHIFNLRRKLRKIGSNIRTVRRFNKTYYYMVRIIGNRE